MQFYCEFTWFPGTTREEVAEQRERVRHVAEVIGKAGGGSGVRGHGDGLLVHLTVVGSLLPGWDATRGLSTLIHSIMIGSMPGRDDLPPSAPSPPDPAGRELTAREAAALAREADERTEEEITADLSRILGRKVIPHIEIDGGILGGIVVRWGDRLMDGSLRRKLMRLRNRMLETTVTV